MKCGAAESWLSQRLEKHYSPSESAAIAAVALQHLTGYERGRKLLYKDTELSNEQQEQLAAMAARLEAQEPVQYVTAVAPFYGLELYVDSSVLIPRPETEELVDWIIQDVKARGTEVFSKGVSDADATQTLKIMDVGTGSGCIALALKNKMPRAEVWGCDVSEEALNVARRNASGTDIRVDFQGVDFLDESQHRLLPSVDILVSNPPYIPERDKASMHENVLRFEPHRALFVPDEDALLFYRALARFAKIRLHPGGSIYLEIHEDLGPAVVELFKKEGHDHVALKKDMQGKDRMVRVGPGA